MGACKKVIVKFLAVFFAAVLVEMFVAPLRATAAGDTDAQLQKELKAALQRDSRLEGAKIDAAVIHRVAYISGAVDSEFEKAEAEDVASRIKGIAAVRNRLNAEPEISVYYYNWPFYSPYLRPYDNEPPYAISETPGPGIPADKQLKHRIEDALFWSPFVDRKNVSVRVDGGVVTLTGTIGTWIGWNEADRDARDSGAAYVKDRIKVRERHSI
jgi:osmotically-inducible protein OsmY